MKVPVIPFIGYIGCVGWISFIDAAVRNAAGGEKVVAL
jgi:hypothetical protein